MIFIEQNYLWFIIAGIIITMIIVGYIAEKTDFGHKKIEKQVKPKIEKVTPEKETKIEDLKNVKLGDVVYKDILVPTAESKPLENNDELSKTELDALSVPLGETQVVPEVKEDSNQLSKEEIGALSVPIGNTPVIEPVPTIEEASEPVTEPIEAINLDTNKEQPSSTIEKEDNVWEDKPIEETKNDATNVESEEDIWKF